MLQPKTETQFAVARAGEIISDGYPTPTIAKQQLAHVSDTMRSVGLEPDVEIVTVEVKTTLGKPKTWIDPDAVDEADEAPAEEPVQDPPAKPAKPTPPPAE